MYITNDKFTPMDYGEPIYSIIHKEYSEYGKDMYYWMKNEKDPSDVIYLSEGCLKNHYNKL